MSDDLIERLRENGNPSTSSWSRCIDLCNEAAAELKAARKRIAELEQFKRTYDACNDGLRRIGMGDAAEVIEQLAERAELKGRAERAEAELAAFKAKQFDPVCTGRLVDGRYVPDCTLMKAELAAVREDAERLRYLLDNCTESYCMGIDTPAEHTVLFQWQQAKLHEAGWSVRDAIDAARGRS